MKHAIAVVVLLASTARVAIGSTTAISVGDVWSRPATGTAVIYANLRNASDTPDRLIGATSPLATKVELHQSSSKKLPGGSMSMGNMSMPMGGMVMSMNAVSAIPVPAHGSTALSPGGYHLMLDLRSDLHAGQRVPLRLHFARAGWIAVTGRVRPI
jgi:copper(I)-binding protein